VCPIDYTGVNCTVPRQFSCHATVVTPGYSDCIRSNGDGVPGYDTLASGVRVCSGDVCPQSSAAQLWRHVLCGAACSRTRHASSLIAVARTPCPSISPAPSRTMPAFVRRATVSTLRCVRSHAIV
jgi:hypothetical protein